MRWALLLLLLVVRTLRGHPCIVTLGWRRPPLIKRWLTAPIPALWVHVWVHLSSRSLGLRAHSAAGRLLLNRVGRRGTRLRGSISRPLSIILPF